MIINSTGLQKSDLTEYLGFWTTKLREVFGNDFVIRKEGIVDNVATAGSLTCMALEDVVLYLSKQFNPYTAEGEFQDSLYSLVGLTRKYASYTVVTRTIEGVVGTVCDVRSIRFKNSATDDIFELNTAVTIGENGTAVGSFTAIELGAIELESSALLSIIDAPEGISGVYYSEGNVTTVGDDYEDDSEFRMRWIATNSVSANSKTEGGLRTALLSLVKEGSDLIIRQNRGVQTFADLPLHTINIVLKSAESNDTIARRILQCFPDGVGIAGTTTVPLQDSEGTDIDIKFTRAADVPIYFNIEVVLKSGYNLSGVRADIKNAIVKNFVYKMGERVVANDFYQYINSVEGVDYVTTLEVSDTDDNYAPTLTLDYNEYGTVIADHITVEEQ